MRSLFGKRIYRKHYNKLLQTRKDRKRIVLINSVSSVTILVAARDHTIHDMERAPKYFRNMGITCRLYVVKEKNDELDSLTDIHVMKTDQCLWYGVPTQELLVKWLAHKTDLLIVANPKNIPLVNYLATASNSSLKSSMALPGYKRENLDIDLWIESPSQTLDLAEQCVLTYETLMKIGAGPPLLGEK